MKTALFRLFGMIILCWCSVATAGSPLWTFTPLTATTLVLPPNSTATVQYQVTNQSSKVHTLALQPITGIAQRTTGPGVCRDPFVLAGKASCVLSLQVNGSALTQPISDGPLVCEQGSILQCYRPASVDVLRITSAPPTMNATIAVTGSPLTLTTNGSTSTLTITNTSLIVPAMNIMSSFTGTALDGNVTETGNTCANLLPQASCTLTYTPGSTVVAQTNFSIQGSNTNVATAAIMIASGVTLTNVNPASGASSGGAGVTLTGTGLAGTTDITFGGVSATSINVVNSTTATAVTPAHAAGAVDVVITTPSGSATQINGYTYVTTAVGQSAYGGVIACLNGGNNNLIAATADNSTGILWGSLGITTGATSTTDGASNTTTIINTAGETTPNAATICGSYQIDSQGNTPCEAGNTCYNDWFLPAGNNLSSSGQLNCLYSNQSAIGGFASGIYWSSTETNANTAWEQNFSNGTQASLLKGNVINVRCVRAFSP
jgi:hypothetical protein